MTKETTIRWVAKPAVFTLALMPLLWIVWKVVTNDLGGGLNANPIETVNRYLGDWALRFVLIALSITPLVKISGWSTPVRFRRMLGLFAFAYAALHIANYVVADQSFNWADIWADIVKRNFITVGMIAFVILTALAITSPKAAIKKMGAKKWRLLHRSVYAAGILSVLHYWMMVKADLTQPMIHAAILGILLGYRLAVRKKKPAPRSRRPANLQAI